MSSSNVQSLLQINDQLASIIIKCTKDGLMMAGLKPNPVGISKYLSNNASISAIIGFVGAISGSMFINTTDETACFLASRLLGEEIATLDNQALDGLSEIANIIAGQAKAALSTTEYKFERISVPSVIVGTNYSISHYRGMTSISVEFELTEMPLKPGGLPIFTVNMSLMKV
ncbi:MAG: chemotaxis protein CheX [Planctomycetota bacterium]|jgi:chemotaxis protein CheX|nr:chemotaxis protein CheX [Planctomycetota bacterium]